MKNKKNRLQLILEIIRSQKVSSQDELVKLLSEKGFSVTQATLSRDLKKLKVSKVATDKGNYMYIVPNNNDFNHVSSLMNIGSTSSSGNFMGYISLSFSGCMAVIKTRNGYASGLAYDIDLNRPDEILGTIAGADTIFVVLREGVSHEDAKRVLQRFIPVNAVIF